jgi:hypothetical protein
MASKWSVEHETLLADQFVNYSADKVSKREPVSIAEFVKNYSSFWSSQRPSRKIPAIDHKLRDFIEKGREDLVPDVRLPQSVALKCSIYTISPSIGKQKSAS